MVAGRTRPGGSAPVPGAAIAFSQATEHFSTNSPSHVAAAVTAALRQRGNSTSEFGLNTLTILFEARTHRLLIGADQADVGRRETSR